MFPRGFGRTSSRRPVVVPAGAQRDPSDEVVVVSPVQVVGLAAGPGVTVLRAGDEVDASTLVAGYSLIFGASNRTREPEVGNHPAPSTCIEGLAQPPEGVAGLSHVLETVLDTARVLREQLAGYTPWYAHASEIPDERCLRVRSRARTAPEGLDVYDVDVPNTVPFVDQLVLRVAAFRGSPVRARCAVSSTGQLSLLAPRCAAWQPGDRLEVLPEYVPFTNAQALCDHLGIPSNRALFRAEVLATGRVETFTFREVHAQWQECSVVEVFRTIVDVQEDGELYNSTPAVQYTAVADSFAVHRRCSLAIPVSLPPPATTMRLRTQVENTLGGSYRSWSRAQQSQYLETTLTTVKRLTLTQRNELKDLHDKLVACKHELNSPEAPYPLQSLQEEVNALKVQLQALAQTSSEESKLVVAARLAELEARVPEIAGPAERNSVVLTVTPSAPSLEPTRPTPAPTPRRVSVVCAETVRPAGSSLPLEPKVAPVPLQQVARPQQREASLKVYGTHEREPAQPSLLTLVNQWFTQLWANGQSDESGAATSYGTSAAWSEVGLASRCTSSVVDWSRVRRAARCIYKDGGTVPHRRPQLETLLKSSDPAAGASEFLARYAGSTVSWSRTLAAELFTDEFYSTGCCSLYQAHWPGKPPKELLAGAAHNVDQLQEVVMQLLAQFPSPIDLASAHGAATVPFAPLPQTFAQLLADATPCCLPTFAYHTLAPRRSTLEFLQSGELERALGWRDLLAVQLRQFVTAPAWPPQPATLPFPADKVCAAFDAWTARRARSARCPSLDAATQPLHASAEAYCREFQALAHAARTLVQTAAVAADAAVQELNLARKLVSFVQDQQGRHNFLEASAHEQYTTHHVRFFRDFCAFAGDFPVFRAASAPRLQGLLLFYLACPDSFPSLSQSGAARRSGYPLQTLWVQRFTAYQCYSSIMDGLAPTPPPAPECAPDFRLLGHLRFQLHATTALGAECVACNRNGSSSPEFAARVCAALFHHQTHGSQNPVQQEFARVLRVVLRVLLCHPAALPEYLAARHARTLAHFRALLLVPPPDLDHLLALLTSPKALPKSLLH